MATTGDTPFPEPVGIPIEDAIDLHAFAPRAVADVVTTYLAAAVEAGFREVRVVHGRGTGTQRRRVRAVLAEHPVVERYADAPPERGGHGATLVWLRPASAAHDATVVDQFGRQALPFSDAGPIRDEAALQLLVHLAGAGSADRVLDVACGPGLLVRAFARVAGLAVGVDLTPAMLARARELATARVCWVRGHVARLPVRDGAFSIVTSRFAFHHFLDPATVLAEMARACAPGGTVLVADATPPPEAAAAFDHMERLRDPSHVRALPAAELAALFRAAGLSAPRTISYRLEVELEALLATSFPDPGGADAVRALFTAALADDALGMGVHRRGERIWCAYPVTALAATVPSA
ncbi:MAG: methyltransferase domain-containing protein [Candidatus Binatia bacterium]